MCFPRPLKVEQRDRVAAFGEAIRATYPILGQEQTHGRLEASDGLATTQPQTVWWFEDDERRWRVSLTPEFLALDTTAYTSRSDFISRLRDVVLALEQHVGPKHVERLRVRYFDQIVGDTRHEIEKLVRPEVRGIAGTAASVHALHTLTESMFALEGAYLVTRWGQISAEADVDAAAIELTSQTSWVFDLDMCSAEAFPFSVDRVVADARRFAEHIYTVWRWAITDAYLKHNRGRPCWRGNSRVAEVLSWLESPHPAGASAECSARAFLLGWTLVEPKTFTAPTCLRRALYPPKYVAAEATVTREEHASTALAELRRLSGLTWEQLAQLFQVTRRSLHFWASGKAMTSANEVRLRTLLATIRQIDRGSASANRALLMADRGTGHTAFEMLVNGEYDHVLAFLGPGNVSPRVHPPRPAQEVVAARAPRPPEALVGALQDRVHSEKAGKVTARPIHVSRKK
jgi:uncharacterized protein (TIGR04255 family)